MLEILLRFLVNLCSNDMHATNSPLQANIYCGVPGQWFFYSLLRFEFRPLIYPSKYHWFFPTSTCTFSQYFFSPPPKKWRIVYCSKKINLIQQVLFRKRKKITAGLFSVSNEWRDYFITLTCENWFPWFSCQQANHLLY